MLAVCTSLSRIRLPRSRAPPCLATSPARSSVEPPRRWARSLVPLPREPCQPRQPHQPRHHALPSRAFCQLLFILNASPASGFGTRGYPSAVALSLFASCFGMRGYPSAIASVLFFASRFGTRGHPSAVAVSDVPRSPVFRLHPYCIRVVRWRRPSALCSLSVFSPSRRWVSRRVLVHVAGRGVRASALASIVLQPPPLPAHPVCRVVAAAPRLSLPGRAIAVCAIHSCFRALVFSARCSRMQFDLRLVFRGWPRSLTSGSCSGDGLAV